MLLTKLLSLLNVRMRRWQKVKKKELKFVEKLTSNKGIKKKLGLISMVGVLYVLLIAAI